MGLARLMVEQKQRGQRIGRQSKGIQDHGAKITVKNRLRSEGRIIQVIAAHEQDSQKQMQPAEDCQPWCGFKTKAY